MAILAVFTAATLAADVSVSAPLVHISKFHEKSKIESRIEPYRSDPDNLLAAWSSTANVMPISNNALSHRVFGDFIGITRMKGEPTLTLDAGGHYFKAKRIPMKGWAVDLPNGPITAYKMEKKRRRVFLCFWEDYMQEVKVTLPALKPGSYSLEWRVPAYNEENEVVIVVIPINWKSASTEIAANHFVIQKAPEKADQMSDKDLTGYLRGFVPIESSTTNIQKVNVVTSSPALTQNPIIQPLSIPPKVETTKPVELPKVAETPKVSEMPKVIELPKVVELPKVIETPKVVEVPETTDLQFDGEVNTGKTNIQPQTITLPVQPIVPPVQKVQESSPLPSLGSPTDTFAQIVPAKPDLKPVKLAIWKAGICNVYDIMLDVKLLTPGCKIRFRRNGELVSEASYNQSFMKGGNFYAECYLDKDQQWPMPQDIISTANAVKGN